MRTWGLTDTSFQSNTAWEVVWVLFVLGVVVALIVLLLRVFAKRNRGWWMNRSLRSLGGLTLGTNKSMQVVEWNGRIYVLGVGDNVTLLEAITDEETVAALLAEHEAAQEAGAPSVPEWLGRFVRRSGPAASADKPAGEPDRPSFEQTLESRLTQMSERRQRVEQLLEESRSPDRNERP